MIATMQLIFICDHLVDDISSTFREEEIIRDAVNDYDIICPDFIIGNIYSVSSVDDNGKTIYYYEGIHYQKFTTDKLQWISSTRPNPGDKYSIEYLKIKRTVIKYEQEYCTKCNGNGWYVDIVNSAGSSVETISGQDKIMQDFVKIVLTSNTDGTPDLTSFTGSSDYKDTIEQISNFIKRCEDKYMQRQSSMISDGTQLNSDEILNKVLITEIDYDKDLSVYFISITLITNNGQAISVGLKV